MQDAYDREDGVTIQAFKTILVVEDDIHVGYLLSQTFKEEASYRVMFATDALQALNMIHIVLPDLIVSDYHLPQMDGLEFIDHLRASNESKDIPVVLISGNLPVRLPMRTKVTYLKKPFELDALLQQVSHLLVQSAPG